MPHITAAITDDLHTRVKEYAESYGVPYTQAMLTLIDAGLVADATPTPLTPSDDAPDHHNYGPRAPEPPAPPTLDEACAVLMEHIRPEQAELIRALGAETGFTPTNYILGYAKIAHERGETAGMFDERVRYDRDTPGAQTVVSPVAAEGTCEYCRATFTPTRPGQRFCPDPDDGTQPCGRAWTLANQIHPTRPHRAPSPFAPPRTQPVSADMETARVLAQLKAQINALTEKIGA